MWSIFHLLEPQPFSLLLLILFLFVFKWFFTIPKGDRNLPPSPSKLPIIGNLHQLGSRPHRTLRSLALQHGPLMLLRLGSVPTLVVSSADLAREILKTHDAVFSSRPSSAIGRRVTYDYKDVGLVPYGRYWRQMKSICVTHLLSAKRVQSYRTVREEETALMIDKIEESYYSSTLVNLSELFASLTNDVICRVAFGRKYRQGIDGKKFKELQEELGALLGGFYVGDFVPWLACLNYITGLNAKVEKVSREYDRFLDRIVDDHMVRRSQATDGCGGEKEDQMDFVDVLLEIQSQSSSTDGVFMGRDNIKAIILDMFAAGTDTTFTLLEWAVTELLRHPTAMKEVQKEIRGIAGSQTNINEDDVKGMDYLKAVIKETLRLHPPLPILVPRESTDDVKVQGYDILAKTRVIVNAWAIGRDPILWEEAEEFKPERFLNTPIDLKGHDFQLIPFGAGRRGCPGNTFAMAIAELVLASILHKFDWALPGKSKGEDLDVTESIGINAHLKFPLLVSATPHYF